MDRKLTCADCAHLPEAKPLNCYGWRVVGMVWCEETGLAPGIWTGPFCDPCACFRRIGLWARLRRRLFGARKGK